jgi:hypothetical protein
VGTFKLTGYHGTDKSVANSILNEGFLCKKNKEHWLGEGIYLYIDKSLAEWWTTKPTQKHGIDIKNPVVVECEIELDESRVLNLCSLDNYEKYISLYNSFFREWGYGYRPTGEVSFKELRCAFFNYVSLVFQIDVIIAPFILPNQPYMPQYANTQFANEMHILYTEVQVCIREDKQSIIKRKNIIELERGKQDG